MRGAKGRNAEERLKPLIHVVRGQRVILDELSAADLVSLRSQFVTSKENIDGREIS
jgi:hypothetical protein